MSGKIMQLNDRIREYLESHRDEIVGELKELIKFKSVRGEAEEKAPFGKACAEILKYTESLYLKEGFETELDEDGGYLLSYFGKGDRTLGLFAHADVVPVGDDWMLTNPFEPLEQNDCIIGRGALDNKSAVLISLYCAKLIKELSIPFNSLLVMFTGSNEESGMGDIKYFLSRNKAPDFSLVCDTAFPLYRGNKGVIRFASESVDCLSSGVSINGGTGATVIGGATAVLPFSGDLLAQLEAANDDRITVLQKGDRLEVSAKGIPKHSAIPEGSLNAVAVLAKALLECKTLNENDRRLFATLYKMANCHYGEFFGIENDDEEYGKLTCVLAQVGTFQNGKVEVRFNIRYGEGAVTDDIVNKSAEKLRLCGFGEPNVSMCSVPHTLKSDDSRVVELLNVYKEFTGNEKAVSCVNAGGTYRQYLKNAVETGPTLRFGGVEGLINGHGGAHQPDEYINITGLLRAIELTLLMLLKCDGIML